jgi:hypothetical protein
LPFYRQPWFTIITIVLTAIVVFVVWLILKKSASLRQRIHSQTASSTVNPTNINCGLQTDQTSLSPCRAKRLDACPLRGLREGIKVNYLMFIEIGGKADLQ